MAQNLPDKKGQRAIHDALTELQAWKRAAHEAYEAEYDPEVRTQLKRDRDDLEYVCFTIEQLLHPHR